MRSRFHHWRTRSGSILRLHFDLILLDLMLPARSGLEVLRDMRQTGVHVPVLILHLARLD